MLALSTRVVDAAWAAVEPLLPPTPPDAHPLGCHRPRLSDRSCFEAILHRLVTGCSWDVAGTLGKGSESTLRDVVTTGWPPGCSTPWPPRPSPPMTAESGPAR